MTRVSKISLSKLSRRVRGDIFLKPKEARRLFIMEKVMADMMTASQAGEILQLGSRRIFRLKKEITEKGAPALIHGNRGRTPKNATPRDIREIVEELARNTYYDTNNTHMAELLQERDGITSGNENFFPLKTFLFLKKIFIPRKWGINHKQLRRYDRIAVFIRVLYYDIFPVR